MNAHPSARQGSVILFALAIVAVASMTAYAFIISMQSAGTVAKDVIVTGLAEAAARMGNRHAYEVAMSDLRATPAGNTHAVGPHFYHFMPTKQYATTWQPPDGGLLTYFMVDPQNDGVDNVLLEARLWHMLHGYADFNDDGTSVYDWGNQMSPNGSRYTQMLSTGCARYIEPGRYSTTGAIIPFSDSLASPTTSPDVNDKVWYDANWRPVTDPLKARYRLRYAVNAMDLGGHLLWGSQLPYSATRVANASGINVSTPTEWDEDLAKTYHPAFTNMMGVGGDSDLLHTTYLGQGAPTAMPQTEDQWQWDSLLMGFDATTGLPAACNWYPGVMPTKTTNKTWLATAVRGGPPSWSVATRINFIGDRLLTPFGRASRYVPPPTPLATYYDARVSTPWRINPLTAPAGTIKLMIQGYLPAQMLKCVYGETSEKLNDRTTLVTDYGKQGYPRAYNTGVQIQSELFKPVELASAPGGNPFAEFVSPVFAPAFPSITIYPKSTDPSPKPAYPDFGEYWEDYEGMENNPAYRSVDNSGWPEWNETPNKEAMKRLMGPCIGTYREYYQGGGPGAFNDSREVFRGLFGDTWWLERSGDLRKDDATGHWFTLWVEGHQANNPRYHRDSYWLDLAAAMTAAVMQAKAQHMTTALCGSDYSTTWNPWQYRWDNSWQAPLDKQLTPFIDGASHGYPGMNRDPVANPFTPKDLDRMFLANLGEYFGDEVMSDNKAITDFGNAKQSIRVRRLGLQGSEVTDISNRVKAGQSSVWPVTGPQDWNNLTKDSWTRPILEYASMNYHKGSNWYSLNIRSLGPFLKTTLYDNTDAAPYNDQNQVDNIVKRKQANMELVLNDFRMSFLGANPRYTDFTPIDFDGDGVACCSAYSNKMKLLPAAFPTWEIRCRPITPAAADPMTVLGKGPPPDFYFSMTGYFVFEKARYFRTLVRGEVFDQFLKKPIAEANLESAFVIDPEGPAVPVASPPAAGSTTLYTRWISNLYRGSLPKTQ